MSSSTTVFPPSTRLEFPPGVDGGVVVGVVVPEDGGTVEVDVVPLGGTVPPLLVGATGDRAGGIENGSRPVNTGCGLIPFEGETVGVSAVAPPPPGGAW